MGPGDTLKNAEVAASDALSTVQDFVCEELTVPWPETASGHRPVPRVRVTGNAIEWWFEDESGEAVLTVPAIEW